MEKIYYVRCGNESEFFTTKSSADLYAKKLRNFDLKCNVGEGIVDNVIPGAIRLQTYYCFKYDMRTQKLEETLQHSILSDKNNRWKLEKVMDNDIIFKVEIDNNNKVCYARILEVLKSKIKDYKMMDDEELNNNEGMWIYFNK